jgi:hypothetical protein
LLGSLLAWADRKDYSRWKRHGRSHSFPKRRRRHGQQCAREQRRAEFGWQRLRRRRDCHIIGGCGRYRHRHRLQHRRGCSGGYTEEDGKSPQFADYQGLQNYYGLTAKPACRAARMPPTLPLAGSGASGPLPSPSPVNGIAISSSSPRLVPMARANGVLREPLVATASRPRGA